MTALGGDLGLQLVVVNGALEGETFAIDGPMIIGRSRPGIVLPDHTVSIKHARIEPRGEGLVIVDLGSKMGTRVNGQPIEPEKMVAVDLGDRIGVGETEFRVDSVANRMVSRALWMMVPAWVLVIAALVVLWVASAERPLVLEFSEPVRVPTPTSSLEVPSAFARIHGLALDRITLLDVRDDDGDGIDELWLGKDDRELVVTFDQQGTWRSRGSVPEGCNPRFADGAPQVDCGGILYQLVADQYEPVLQEGVVVWMTGKARGTTRPSATAPQPAKAKKKKGKNKAAPDAAPETVAVPLTRGLDGPESLVALRVELGQPSLLAGFLSERGVHGAVQYILCEDQGFGLDAQVRLADGSFEALDFGCGQALRLDGLHEEAFDGARIVAVAFTATAWKLLPRDLSTTVTGAADWRMAAPAERRALGRWEQSPRSAIAYGLGARGVEQGFQPDATENQRMVPKPMLGAEVPAAVGGRLLNRGIAELSAGACTYRVQTNHFRCARIRGCLPGATFVSVVEKGCGPERTVLKAGYGAGLTRRETDNAVVQLEVEASGAGGFGVTDVALASIAIRAKTPAP